MAARHFCSSEPPDANCSGTICASRIDNRPISGSVKSMTVIDHTVVSTRVSQFPFSPVLADIADLAHRRHDIEWSRVGVVCAQHLLASTASLIDTLVALGVTPQNILICGKSYSTSAAVATALRQRGITVRSTDTSGRVVGFQRVFQDEIDKLWALAVRQKLFERCNHVVILDDGGHCIDRAPNAPAIRQKLVAVEQTTAGIRRLALGLTIPVINVAQAAAKTILESPLICEVVLTKARPYLTQGLRVGVVGVGNIGTALVGLLMRHSYSVTCYDQIGVSAVTAPTVPVGCWRPSLELLLRDSDTVFGCTGTDAFGTDWCGALQHDLTLISCSSEDLEFRSLINHLGIVGGGLTDDIVVNVNNDVARLTIARGGFPVNFDGSIESVPSNDIQLTRGLLFGGIIQALTPGLPPGISMLSPSLQRYVVRSWFRHRPVRLASYADDIVRGFSDVDWIRNQSFGHCHRQQTLDDMLGE